MTRYKYFINYVVHMIWSILMQHAHLRKSWASQQACFLPYICSPHTWHDILNTRNTYILIKWTSLKLKPMTYKLNVLCKVLKTTYLRKHKSVLSIFRFYLLQIKTLLFVILLPLFLIFQDDSHQKTQMR